MCKEVEVSEIVTQTFHTSHCHEYLFLYILHESHVCIPVSGDLHGGTTCLIFVSYWKWVRHMEDSNYYYFYYYYIYIRMPNCEDWLTAGMSYIMLLAILSVRKCVAYIWVLFYNFYHLVIETTSSWHICTMSFFIGYYIVNCGTSISDGHFHISFCREQLTEVVTAVHMATHVLLCPLHSQSLTPPRVTVHFFHSSHVRECCQHLSHSLACLWSPMHPHTCC